MHFYALILNSTIELKGKASEMTSAQGYPKTRMGNLQYQQNNTCQSAFKFDPPSASKIDPPLSMNL